MTVEIGSIIDFHGESVEVVALSDEPHGAWLSKDFGSFHNRIGDVVFYCPNIKGLETILRPCDRPPLYGRYPVRENV